MNKHDELNRLFAQAKSAPVVASFEETKTAFTKSVRLIKVSAPGKLTSMFNLKFLIMTISGITVLGLSVWFFLNESTITEHPKKTLLQTEKKVDTQLNNTKLSQKVTQPASTQRINDLKNIPVKDSDEFYFEPTPKDELLPPKMIYPKLMNRALPSEPFFPTLTQKQIDANHKQKKKMTKALAKTMIKKDTRMGYSYIPAGSFDYNGTIVSVQSFFMQQTEVTNLEYRTFLFDLLIQGRKDDFLIARPDQTQWVKVFGEKQQAMQDNYFSDEAYNDYPVVNVSRKGAEMYCVWLTKETNASLGENEKINDVRIPTRMEWVKAASNDGKQLPFASGVEITINEDSSHAYVANFNSKLSPNDRKLSKHQTDFIFEVKSFIANDRGLYNMSGNVAEMVNNAQTKWEGFGTAGGGWLNSLDEIKIYGQDPYKDVEDPHPGIGFRVVISNVATTNLKPKMSTSSIGTNYSEDHTRGSFVITRQTTKQELLEFKEFAKNKGWDLSSRSRHLGSRLNFLELNLEENQPLQACGGLYFKTSYFGKNQLNITWTKDLNGRTYFDWSYEKI